MNATIWFLVAQAILEFGQALVDLLATKQYARATIMICAGISSLALTLIS